MPYPIVLRLPLVLVLIGCASCSGNREEDTSRTVPAPSQTTPSAASNAAVCSVPQTGFARSLRVQVPASVAEAGRLLNEALSDEAKTYLACEPQVDDAVAALHFSVGRAVRNRWLYGPKGEKLMVELKKLGVTTHDGASAALILLARTLLKNQESEFPSQLGEYLRAAR